MDELVELALHNCFEIRKFCILALCNVIVKQASIPVFHSLFYYHHHILIIRVLGAGMHLSESDPDYALNTIHTYCKYCSL